MVRKCAAGYSVEGEEGGVSKIHSPASIALSLSKDGRKKKIIGIEAAAENDGMDMFEQAGVAAE
jgi:hypothetical protein